MARSIRMNRFSWAPYGQFSTMSNLTMLDRMCFNVPVARIVLVVFVSFCAGYLTQLCQSSLSSSSRQCLLSSLCEIYRSYLKNGLTMRLDVPIGCPCKKYCCGGYNAMAPPASTRWSSICKVATSKTHTVHPYDASSSSDFTPSLHVGGEIAIVILVKAALEKSMCKRNHDARHDALFAADILQLLELQFLA
ncbi:hypothetical protein TRIUR3_33422 [Triticum urartu]|uniref:Uncharacterized protein n=1 Tax=Triticum urartu TaxID=4572 RepID=M7Y8R2_TRIUA|nr:hypothetical protein TRIUR3_33422 [Triticum urartu]